MTPELVVGDDGLTRCAWGAAPVEYRTYHDTEWGRPVGDDDRIYEKLCLEGFQSGLSWLTILRKREGFRRAFASFDPHVVATFGEEDVERLLGDKAIVRHRAKILATITNAKATVVLRDRGCSLAGTVWRYRPAAPRVPTGRSQIPSSTPESKALAHLLRRYGFVFVGPTTAYAAMQALGVVNDHLQGCDLREEAEAQRRVFEVPAPTVAME